jgi:uncharacterized membrane protein YwaF
VDAEQPRDPVPWERKAAIGCLLLLSMQMSHDSLRYSLGHPSGYELMHLSWILLLLFLSVAVGLLFRYRAAWWCGVILIGSVGVLLLTASTNPIMATIRWQLQLREYPDAVRPLMRVQSSEILDGFQLFWLVARNLMALAVPTFLVLGRLRQALKRPTP